MKPYDDIDDIDDNEEAFKDALKVVIETRAEELDLFDGFKKPDVKFSPEMKQMKEDTVFHLLRSKPNFRMAYRIVAVACVLILMITVFTGTDFLSRLKQYETTGTPTQALQSLPVSDEIATDYETVYEHFKGMASGSNELNDIISALKDNDGMRAESSSDGIVAVGEESMMMAVPPISDSVPDTSSKLAPSGMSQEIAADSAEPARDADTAGSSENPAYSETNNQVKDVMEADIVKTDGKYIYAINSEYLYVLLANDGNPQILSKIPQDAEVGASGGTYFEMYITKDRIIAIRQESNIPLAAIEELKEAKLENGDICIPEVRDDKIIYPGTAIRTDSIVDLFDITDPENPQKSGTLSQSGEYLNSRMVGDILYLITNFCDFDYAVIEKDKPETYVPLFTDNGTQIVPTVSNIVIPSDNDATSYTVVGGIDTVDGGSLVSTKSILDYTDNVYATKDSIYFTTWAEADIQTSNSGNFSIRSTTDRSLLTRLSIQDGMVEIKASTIIPGNILNQFSMDEYEGVFRVVANVYTYNEATNTSSNPNELKGSELGKTPPQTAPMNTMESSEIDEFIDYGYSEDHYNALYTLDDDLKLIGSISNIAPGEEIYSCRFIENIAYFVTFRNTDPLFSVDITNPAAPKILGVLKIPGFSEYLHPYSEGRLFGLGRDADPESGEVKGLKLSMFDNSNPADVREKHTLVIKSETDSKDEFYDAYSEAESNHKAILVDETKKLIAFPMNGQYVIYTYDDKTGFKKVDDIDLPKYADADGDEYNDIYSDGLRGLFIGDVFYVISPNVIMTYDMAHDFKQIGSAVLSETAAAASQYNYNRYPFLEGDTVMPFRGFVME
ncbi:MAG: beta-propeller domain-containing protein [Clostridiales Family XIII bacterium]|jgi:uncharacterized secreted protein with C-terminal beta-propeller domain|nr:beta-propeller domain-containing protein [Clostridiales Family XIII bacterium]